MDGIRLRSSSWPAFMHLRGGAGVMDLPPIHLNSVTARGMPIGEVIPMAGRCGFAGMELWLHDAAPQSLTAADRKLGSDRFGWNPEAAPVDEADVSRLAETNGITIDGILPGTDAMLHWSGKLDAQLLASIGEAISLCARLNARYVLLPVLDGDAPPGTIATNLREIGALAREQGVLLGIEPIGHVPRLNSVGAVLELIEQAATGGTAGIVLDAFHFFRARQDLRVLDAIPLDLLVAVQINDAVDMPIEDMIGNLHREFPGKGVFDVTAFCAKIMGIGYAGPFTIEIINPEMRSDTPDRARDLCRRAFATGTEVLRVAAGVQGERRH